MATEPEVVPPDAATRNRVQAVRSSIDLGEMRRMLEELPGPRSPLHQPDASIRTVELLTSWFEHAGWSVATQRFDLKAVAATWSRLIARYLPPSASGVNVVASLPGETTEALVVGAHHDTLPETPGADDNGAGLVALATLARLLAAKRRACSLVLVAFDFEELGFHGARHFVATAGHDIRSAIIYETMAFTSSEPGSQAIPPGLGLLFPRQVRAIRSRQYVGDWTALIYRRPGEHAAARLATCLAAIDGTDRAVLLRDPTDLPVLGGLLRAVAPPVRNFARSDHVPFWAAGIPAVQVTDTANFRNPHYHRPTDTPETVDLDRLATIVAATAVTLEDLAGPALG